MNLQLEHWPVDRLIAYARNPRENDHAVDQMAAVIREFGFRIPCVVRSNGELVDGHLRLKAARKLGLESVPVVLADELTEAQVKAFRLLANRSATWANWDEQLLQLELADLDALEFDLALTGFDDDEIEEMLAAVSGEGQTEEDAAPEPEEHPISRPGDVWICGEHRVLCGDATRAEDYAALLGDELIDMTFTDPPYNVDYANNPKDKLRGKRRPILNDNLGDDFGAFLQATCAEMLRVTKGAIYIAMSSSELDRLQTAFRAAGGRWSTFIIWAKNKFTLGHADYQRQYEPILYGWRDGNDRFWCGARDQGDVWFIDRAARNELHPTMKPVALVERAIRNSSKTRDLVLDPFGGSGTTMIACEKTGRRARLIELDPKYVDVIVRRWQDYTGRQAVRGSDGAAFIAADPEVEVAA
ncbi:DNA modification methylase [Lysobacter enzymogenes]|uniref:DNA modification methylase n=1 Tax=Lysobacter enzymogenes TaxID=69 RepID=UPI001AF89F70|nr:DNA modification methylase [Lysobacter enzymogenes]QQQ00915.1 DNA modification methylase [Lysobacter enzymogenes]